MAEVKTKVSLLGSPSIDITVQSEGLVTAAQIVQAAADALDVDVVIAEVAIVANGEQVGPQDSIPNEATVAAAAAVSNGS